LKKFLLILFFLAFISDISLASEKNNSSLLTPNSSPSRNASGVENRKISVDPVNNKDGFSAILYDNTNGLPTSETNAIAETSEGFIWIGCYSGLIRYDGNTFVRLSSTTGIASVVSLYVDKKDRLWVGTNDLGIALIERGEIYRWSYYNGMKSLQVTAIAEDEQGRIYAATATGIAMIDPENMKLSYIDDPRLVDAPIESLRVGNDGLIYGVTHGSDFFIIENGVLTNYLSHEDTGLRGVEYLLPDPNNPGWVYFEAGNKIYYGNIEKRLEGSRILANISPLTSVDCLEFIDGKIWIGARNGIGVLTEHEMKILRDLPMNNSICNIMTDYEGNLWFTSDRQGVMKIVKNQFSNLFGHYNLPEAMVNATCLYNNKIFMGTDTGLIVIDENDDSGKVSSIPLKKAVTASGVELKDKDLLEMLKGKRIRSLTRDSKNRLWISTWQTRGLLRYDDGELTAFTDQDGLMSNRIRVAYERKDGSMLVVNTGGVSVISGDKVIRNYNRDDGITIFESLSVCEGFHDDIVLGSNGGGIYVISDKGTRNIGLPDGLTSGIIMRVKRDEKRKIFWIVTSNSFAYMTEDYQVHTFWDFPYSNNYDLYEDSKGNIWVLASNGIYIAPADELLANNKIHPIHYGISNGMSSTPTGNSYSELSPEGDLYIAARTGVIKVNIEKPFENIDDVKVAVPFIDVDGKRVYPDKDGTFHISADVQKITINSFVYNYSLINPKLTYQLEGFEERNAPINRSDLLPVDYTNLRGGTYNFIIRLMDSIGQNSREISAKIVKETSFYEETWFYILSSILLAFILAEIVRAYVEWKTMKLKRQQEEDMMLIREITESFARLIDIKDEYTNGHSFRVANYTAMLAKELGYSNEITEKYYRIALLHDIGKIGVPDSVLN